MRKLIDLQMEFWKKDIPDIQFDIKSRDEIPKLLMGLQYIYSDPKIRRQVFSILNIIVPKRSHEYGRPGMDLWKILVLGTLRLNCAWDFDKVHEIANNHRIVRQMLGHTDKEFDLQYALQTIKDNISLLTPEILDEINHVAVRAGHDLVRGNRDEPLKGSCDSFVVETDVHYPTDANLLFDAVRKMITLIAVVCSETGITEWRQSHHNSLKAKKMLRKIQLLKRSTSKDKAKKLQREELIVKAYQDYITVCWGFVTKTKETIRILRGLELLSTSNHLKLSKIEEFIVHAERQIDQIQRRVVLDEKIPHKEKMFSIFEPHTEWISKGKAGVPQELGLRVCVLKDQYGFILHHQVMEQSTDDKVAVSITQAAKDRYPDLSICSYDKGFYSPSNKKDLGEILYQVILPKKGRLSSRDKEIEKSEEFIKLRHKHSGVESSIHALENHGLGRCLDHGFDGFKRYVALSVLARNIQILGHLLQQRELKRQQRRKAA